MSTTKRLVEGWTEAIVYNLQRDGASFNGTGTTVSLVAVDSRGVALSLAGTTAWVSASASQVGFTPAAADLKAARSPLRVRFKVVSGSGIAYYPQEEPLQWAIDRQPA